MGGKIGFHLLKKYPDLIKSLVMISSNYYGINETEKRKKRLESDLSLLEKIHTTESTKPF